MDAMYKPLMRSDSPETASDDSHYSLPYEPRAARVLRKATYFALIFSSLVNVLLLVILSRSITHQPQHDPIWGVGEPLYSPAQSHVRYERRVFDYLGEKTKYHGPPTDETDIAWNLLYPVGETRITKAEANMLPNRTDEIPNDPDHYIITLDVFHQLHCLNTIRKALSPERYGPTGPSTVYYKGEWIDLDHADHCINVIRESLMCSADITPNVWQWDERINMSWPHFDSIHTCRSWDAISEWAAEHKLLEPYDMYSGGGLHGHHHHDHNHNHDDNHT